MRTFAIACLFAAVAVAAPAEDLMGSLPETSPFDSNTYSGYLSATETKKLHYVFAESLDNPETDPVVIWFNGGPGCSSMLGFMQENGPRVIEDGSYRVHENPFPWNARANVMWLESPAGVGFSTAGTEQDWKTNDMIQSVDAMNALKDFYTKFPEFKKSELFISGESYAGIYVPYLAWQVYQNNLQAEFNDELYHINIQGTMVGNGATNWSYDVDPTFAQTVAGMSIIPQSLLAKWEENDCHRYFMDVRPATKTPICTATWAQINKLTWNLNWYDLYRPNFPTGFPVDNAEYGTAIVNGEEKTYRRGVSQAEYAKFAKHLQEMPDNGVKVGDVVADYMNREDVRDAFNIPHDVQAWESCSNILEYHTQNEASQWIYGVLKNQTKLMFYSGDSDGAVPTYGSKLWIKELNWKVEEAWRPWYTNGQVSGYIEKFDGLDFITVKGTGHMAPQWKRQEVTEMISAYIHNEAI